MEDYEDRWVSCHKLKELVTVNICYFCGKEGLKSLSHNVGVFAVTVVAVDSTGDFEAQLLVE